MTRRLFWELIGIALRARDFERARTLLRELETQTNHRTQAGAGT